MKNLIGAITIISLTHLTSWADSTWVSQASPFMEVSYGAVAYANGTYMAVGNGFDKSAPIITSKNGLNWTAHESGVKSQLTGIAWTGKYWIVVGAAGNTGGCILYSEDGATWTKVFTDPKFEFSSVIWTGTFAVAIGSYYTAGGYNSMVYVSPDGVKWTYANRSGESDIAVAWTGTAIAGLGPRYSYLSADGVKWNFAEHGLAISPRSMVWTGTKLVAVGFPTAPRKKTPISYESTDGISWTALKSDSLMYLESLTATNSGFLAAGWQALTGLGEGLILSSKDGKDWTKVGPKTNALLKSVVWSGAGPVVVGGSAIFAYTDVPSSIRSSRFPSRHGYGKNEILGHLPYFLVEDSDGGKLHPRISTADGRCVLEPFRR